MTKLKIKAFSLAGGIVWGAACLFMGLFASLGYGGGFVEAVSSVYLGYAAGLVGAIIGGVWAFVDGAIACAIFAWLYNKLQ